MKIKLPSFRLAWYCTGGFHLLPGIFALALFFLAARPATAGQRYWTNTLNDASFTLTSGNFVPTGTFTITDDLILGTSSAYGGTNITAAGGANVRSSAKIHSLTFSNNFNSSNTFTLGSVNTGSSSFTLTFGGINPYLQSTCTNGVITINKWEPATSPTSGALVLYLTNNLDIIAGFGGAIAINCTVAQTNSAFGITNDSGGVVTLGASNIFTGFTQNSGTLNVNHANALGLPAGTLTIAGGTLDNTSGGALTIAGNNVQTWSGNFGFAGTYDLNLGTGAVTLSATPIVTVNAGNLTVGGAIGPSSGGFGLSVAGGGNLILNAANTYNGNTTVSAGKLTLGASASIASSPNIAVNGTLDVSAVSGFSLGGSQSLLGVGTVTGSVSTVSGSAIFPGADGTTGTLTLANTLTLAGGATCNFDLGSTAAGANDQLIVNGTGTALTLNNNSFVIKAVVTLDTSIDYLLVSVPNGTISGTFNSVPTWSGTPPANFGYYSVVTTTNAVKLHYSAPVNNNLDHFVVTTSGSPTTAGTNFTVTVQAQNSSNGNITDNSVDGTLVTLTSTGNAQFDGDGNGIFGDNYRALTNGTCTLGAKDNKAETISLVGLSGAASGTNLGFVVVAGTGSKLQLLLPGEVAAAGTVNGKTGSPTAEVAGSAFSVVVNAVDAFWNPVGGSDTVQITGSGDANVILPVPTALSGGSITLTVTNRSAGTARTLTATDNSNGGITASTSAAYTVNAGVISQLVLLAPGETLTPGASPGKTGTPNSQTEGIGYPVTVKAMDANWNLAATNDTVGITSSAMGDGLPANAPLSAGSQTYTLTNNTPGSVTITASDISNGIVAASTSTLQVSVVPKYQSAQSGFWSDPATWSASTNGGVTWYPATSTPSAAAADTIVITNGNVVTLSTTLAADQLTVAAGGQLVVSNVSLTINDGPGTDLDVFGTVQVTGASGSVSSSSATIVFENGSVYNHNRDLGTIPTAAWNTNSTCELTGMAAGGAYTGSGALQSFGNFVINSPGMTGDLNFAGTFPPLIAGELDILNTAGQELRLNTTKATTNSIVDGNFVMSGNSFLVVSEGSATNQLTVMGDVLFQGGVIELATTTGQGILNLYGNFAMSTGAQLEVVNTASTNTSLINFNKSGTQTFANAGAFTGSGPGIVWTVNSGSTLDIGTNYLAGSAFLLNAGTLTGQGVIAAPVSGNGSISPGLAAATLTLQKGLDLSSGGTYVWQLAANTTNGPGSNYDVIAVTASNLVLGGASKLSINFTGSSTGPDLANPFWQTAHTWTIISLQGGAPNTTAFTTLLNAHYGSASFTNYADVNGNIVLAYDPGLTTFVPMYDVGAGFFGGENLAFTNVSGLSYNVWSAPSAVALQTVLNWNLEGAMQEQSMAPSMPGQSRYSINVTPANSTVFYIAGFARTAPYLLVPGGQTVEWITTDQFLNYTVYSAGETISSAGVLALPLGQPVSLQTAGSGISLSGTGVPGATFWVQTATNLIPPVSWFTLATNTVDVYGTARFTVTNALGKPRGFYRLAFP